jgi:hypothetical protein
MIEALTMPAILLALAISGAVALYGIIRQWRAERDRQPEPDEAQALLAQLCEQLYERLQQEGTPPRTVINLTAGQWHKVTKQPTTSKKNEHRNSICRRRFQLVRCNANGAWARDHVRPFRPCSHGSGHHDRGRR